MNKPGLGAVAGGKPFGWPVLVVMYHGPKIGQWAVKLTEVGDGTAIATPDRFIVDVVTSRFHPLRDSKDVGVRRGTG